MTTKTNCIMARTKNMTNNVNASNENNEEVINDTIEISGKVLSISTYKDDEKRITFNLDCEPFAAFDKDNKPTMSTSFSEATRSVVAECAKFIPELQLASTLALGKTLNPQIVALCLLGADITSIRELRKKGTPTRAAELGTRVGEVYEDDTWTNAIIKVRPNINPIFQPHIMKLIETALVAKTATVVTSNPYAALGL